MVTYLASITETQSAVLPSGPPTTRPTTLRIDEVRPIATDTLEVDVQLICDTPGCDALCGFSITPVLDGVEKDAIITGVSGRVTFHFAPLATGSHTFSAVFKGVTI